MASLLLVDDNAALRHFTARNLNTAFPTLKVQTASCSTDALAIATRKVPAIVVVDQWLPDGTGIDLLKQLQALEPRPGGILITGDIDALSEARAGHHGWATLAKPFEADDLIGLVYTTLSRANEQQLPPIRAASATYPSVEVSGTSRDIRHRIRNMLAEVVIGLRLLEADLKADGSCMPSVLETTGREIDRLVVTVREAASLITLGCAPEAEHHE